MVELIKGLVQVRDALTLVAFLSLVLLMAFRTPKVPELFFGLVGKKLTREQFSKLLRRFMILGFSAFLILAALAAFAQVLNSRTKPGVLTLDDLRHELNGLQAPPQEKLRAESNFATGTELISKRDFDGAIASLQKSVDAVPTLAAHETLAFLYRQKRDSDKANSSWEAAETIARQRGDSVAQARLDRIRSNPPQNGETDLIGKSTPVPKGGDRFESATEIAEGFYNCSDGCGGLFKVRLRQGQTLQVHFRSGNGSHGLEDTYATFFDTNGEQKSAAGSWGANRVYSGEWTAQASGWHYLGISASPGAVYRISIRD